MIFKKAHTSRANAMLIEDLIDIFSRKLIYRTNAMLIINFYRYFFTKACAMNGRKKEQASKTFQGPFAKRES